MQRLSGSIATHHCHGNKRETEINSTSIQRNYRLAKKKTKQNPPFHSMTFRFRLVTFDNPFSASLSSLTLFLKRERPIKPRIMR